MNRNNAIFGIILSLFISVATFAAASENSDTTIPIAFLDVESAKVAIIDDSIDPFFERLQTMEMSARTGSVIDGDTIEQQRQKAKERYQAGVQDFTDSEKEVIQKTIEKLYPAISKKYPLFAEQPWSFIKVSNTIEGGLPHTRDKYIVLSEIVCRQLATMNRTVPEQALTSMADLLIHEQMHVLQRLYPEIFVSLYTDVWGFIKAQNIESCAWLDKHQIINPDGIDCCWIFPVKEGDNIVYLWPLVVLREGSGLKRMPHDFLMIAVEMEGDGESFRPKMAENDKPVYRNLLDIQQYRNIFPNTSNIYHPNEACASLFSWIVMFDDLRPQESISLQERIQMGTVMEPLRKWFIDNLQKKTELPSQG